MVKKVGCLLFTAVVLLSCKQGAKEKEEKSTGEQTAAKAEFVSIFNGKTLEGWDGDSRYWAVEDGAIVGKQDPDSQLKANTFLIWKGGAPANFELQFDFKISEEGNSGINYRSELVDSIPFALRGYQADMDGQNNYTGQNYEERKRTTLAYIGERAEVFAQKNPEEKGSLQNNVSQNAWQSRKVLDTLGTHDSLTAGIKKGDWNHGRLLVQGNRMQHYINGVLMSETIDLDSINRRDSGLLGLQVHVGHPMRVYYKNMLLKEL